MRLPIDYWNRTSHGSFYENMSDIFVFVVLNSKFVIKINYNLKFSSALNSQLQNLGFVLANQNRVFFIYFSIKSHI